VLPVLLEVIQERNHLSRVRAIEALSRLGSVDDPAISALTRALEDEGAARVKAAEVLGRIGPPAKSAVPALTDLLKESNPEARVQAALALWRIDHRAEEAVPVLVSALKGPLTPRPGSALGLPGRFGTVSSAPPACQQAADALGQIGPEARAAAPALTEVLRDPRFSSYRPDYALALFKIDGQAAGVAIAVLIEVLDGKGHAVRLPEQAASALRKQAAKALGEIGAPAREAVPSLRKALMSPDEAIRSEAAVALKKIGA
jgi:HEAT repeat protein